MASLSAVIVPAKALKDGRHKVRIAVAHNGTVRYLLTDIVVDSTSQFKNGQVTKRSDANYLNTKLRGILQRWQEVLDGIEYPSGLTASELVSAMQNSAQMTRRTLESVYEEYMSTSDMTESSKRVYKSVFSCIKKYIKPNIVLDNITHANVCHLQKSLLESGLSAATARYRLAFLKSILLYAERCGYVHYKINPFNNVKLPQKEVRQSWLSVEEVRKIRDAKFKLKTYSRARDIFMLSYYLGGINVADMTCMDFSKDKDKVTYVRQKTKKFKNVVELPIYDEAREMIKRLSNSEGKFVLEGASNRSFNVFLSLAMKGIGLKLGIDNLIFYSARKSFAQHAFELNVSTATIDYILGHSATKGKSLYSYIKVTPELAAEALRKVLDNLK